MPTMISFAASLVVEITGSASMQVADGQGQVIGAALVAAQQAHGVTGAHVHHHHGRIGALVADMGCYGPNRDTAGGDKHQSTGLAENPGHQIERAGEALRRSRDIHGVMDINPGFREGGGQLGGYRRAGRGQSDQRDHASPALRYPWEKPVS